MSSGDSKDKSEQVKPFRARKGQVQVVKFSLASRYDKQGIDETNHHASNSIRYEIGDMVWGKVKSHPWWPGHVYSEVLASPEVRKSKIPGQVLVAFFGDCSYGWFYPAHLLPFEPNFEDKCKQRSSNRNFGKAVEEAVEEVTRRSGLAFACRCRNQESFRDSAVEGHFCVDVSGCEPGSVYSADQIRKAWEDFKPTEMVDFLSQLATSPTGNDDEGIEFIKNKAAVAAYRKAVYEEVDETYDQAFGHHHDVRTSQRKALAAGNSPKVPTRAPLSGPLVIAEALGKGKGFSKLDKAKAQAKNDQYLFKRRDEANEFGSIVQINRGAVTSSEQPVFTVDSSAKEKDDCDLKKRSPSVSADHMVQEKQESTETGAEDYVSDASEVPVSEGIIMEDKFEVVEVETAGVQVESGKVDSPSKSLVDQDPGRSTHPLEARPSFNKGKYAEMKKKANLVSNVEVGLTSQNSSKVIGEMTRTLESSVVNIDVKDDHPVLSVSVDSDPSLSQATKSEVHDSVSSAYVPETTNAEIQGKDKKIQSDIGEKNLRILNRTVKLNSVSSTALEDQRKKPKTEFFSSQNMQMHPSGGKNGSSVDNVAGKYVRSPVASKDSQVDPQEEEANDSNSFPPNSVATQNALKIENVKLKLPQLLYNLKAIALDPSDHSDSNSAVIQQVFLRFRSLVFQKSLVPLPPANSELKETRRSKPAAAVATNIVSAENARELKSVTMQQKIVVRPDDPAKGGRKRGSSDPQEEIAAKKKMITDTRLLTDQRIAEKSSLVQRGELKETSASTMKSIKPEPIRTTKLLTDHRTAEKSSMMQRGEVKETSASTMKSVKPEPIRNTRLITDQRTAEKSSSMQRGEVTKTSASTMKSVKPEAIGKVQPLSRASDPTMLVLKFPLHGTLPSVNELKARFIRFGPLDHSACRVFWKSLTCRVVFQHKVDAQAAYKFAAASSNLFGNTSVRCYLREMEVAAIEQEPRKVQRDEVSMSTSQLRDSSLEQRYVAPLSSQTVNQSGAQVKSILKRATGDEIGSNGGIRGASRVKFMLGREENSEGAEQLMIGSKNSTNAIFSDGGTSISNAIDFNRKNFQHITSSQLPPLLPTPTTSAYQFRGPPQSNLQYTEEYPGAPKKDISEEMMKLLFQCNDVVNNITAVLGYVPFHPL